MTKLKFVSQLYKPRLEMVFVWIITSKQTGGTEITRK